MAEQSAATETVRDSVIAHLTSVLDDTEVIAEPFSHFYLEGVFPDDVYDQILDGMPDPGLYRALSDKHQLEDGTSTRDVFQLSDGNLDALPEDKRALWKGIAAALRSVALRRKLFGMFRAEMAKRFRVDPGSVEDAEAFPNPALIRDLGGYEIRPHPDSPSKIVTMQLYLPRDDSQSDLGTALYRLRLLKLKNLVSLRNAFEKVKQFPFKPNSAYAFAVTKTTWHGRELVALASEARNSIMNIYYDAPDKGY